MYRKIEPALRMTGNEASSRYRDSFILMQMDSVKLSDDVGTVLYVGEDENEMFALAGKLQLPFSGVVTGLNHLCTLGGVVVGEDKF